MLRLLALLGGLAAALDLGVGAPIEESVKRAVLAVRLARSSGFSDDEVRRTLYTGLLQHLGCTAFSHELGGWLGDDVSAYRAAFVSDWSNRATMMSTFVPMVADGSGRSRARTLAAMLTRGTQIDRLAPVATCDVARDAARRLPLPSGLEEDLAHILTQWNGRGYPSVSGESIPRPTRVMQVASVATLFCLRNGPADALEIVRRRAGTELDPTIADALTAEHVADLLDVDGQVALLDCEPDPIVRVDQPEVERVAEVFGNLADLKSPWLHGHSAGVAAIAGAAAERLGLPAPEVATIRIAGHLHDLGRIAVSSRIWDKSRPLSAAERGQIELHPWHTERILAGVPGLGEAASIARAHHERLDGSGYHREASAAQLSLPARVLAVADRYRTLREDRPHRAALSEAAAGDVLRRDAARGKLDPDAVAAVLQDPAYARRRARPAGLTDRQVTVLQLIAAGRSNRQIAQELVISSRTAEHHVQAVYARVGVSSRAGAAVFAMEHGLFPESG